MAVVSADTLGVNSNDNALVIVPLFHANAWGLPYSATMIGAKLVFPGVNLDGKSVSDALNDEKITYIFGVPTIFLSLFDFMDKVSVTECAVTARQPLFSLHTTSSSITNIIVNH